MTDVTFGIPIYLKYPIESRPEKYFEHAGTRTRDLSTKHAKRVRSRSALHPR